MARARPCRSATSCRVGAIRAAPAPAPELANPAHREARPRSRSPRIASAVTEIPTAISRLNVNIRLQRFRISDFRFRISRRTDWDSCVGCKFEIRNSKFEIFSPSALHIGNLVPVKMI